MGHRASCIIFQNEQSIEFDQYIDILFNFLALTVDITHYVYKTIQYTAAIVAVKMTFQLKYFDIFSYLCSKHILRVHIRTVSMRRF